jgi:hypothetical protein
MPESPHSQQERNQWLGLLSFESYLFKIEWDMMKDSQAILTKLQAIHAVHTELHTPITSVAYATSSSLNGSHDPTSINA